MATIILTNNVDVRVFNMIVDKYGPPKDITNESIELDHNGPKRWLYFNIPGFEERELVQIIGFEDENGSITLTKPMPSSLWRRKDR